MYLVKFNYKNAADGLKWQAQIKSNRFFNQEDKSEEEEEERNQML